MSVYKISNKKIALSDFNKIVNDKDCVLEIDEGVKKGIASSRNLLDKFVKDGSPSVYSVVYDVAVPTQDEIDDFCK